MRSAHGPLLSMIAVLLVSSACTSDDDAATTTEPASAPSDTTTTTVATVPETTTTTKVVVGPPLIEEGDRNETVAAFQWLLTCNGFATLTPDGNFGPATRTAIDEAGGATDLEAFAGLSRSCLEPRPLPADEPVTVVGFTEPGTPAGYVTSLTLGTTLSVSVVDGARVDVVVLGADGEPVDGEDGVWGISTSMDYLIRVDAAPEATLFTLDISTAEGTLDTGGWLMRTNSISYGVTTLTLGDAAGGVIESIYEILGHGPRGSHGEFDTGWDFPGQEGFRGILIEGFRFLFAGPNAEDPDRPETLIRIRVVEPTVDANDEPRPFGYVTTPEGVGVGHTLADLLTVYDTFVRPGSNAEEHYYRLVNQRGELCFYFGASAPTDSSVIIEMSTECRR